MLTKYAMRLYQEFLWVLLRVYLLLSGSTASGGKMRLEPGKSYILAANHRSQLDPFLVCAALPLPVYHRLAPVRFMTYYAYFKPLIYRFLLRVGGSFPTKPFRNLPYGLDFSIKVLERGGTVLIFPEGQRTLPGAVRIRSGVAVLAQIKNTEVIPVWLEWKKGWIFRKVHIVYGTPQPAANLSATQIMQVIYDLSIKPVAARPKSDPKSVEVS